MWTRHSWGMGPFSFFLLCQIAALFKKKSLNCKICDQWRETLCSGFWCEFNFLVKSSSVFLILKKDSFCKCQSNCINPATSVKTDLLFFIGMLTFLAQHHVGWRKYFVLAFPGLFHSSSLPREADVESHSYFISWQNTVGKVFLERVNWSGSWSISSIWNFSFQWVIFIMFPTFTSPDCLLGAILWVQHGSHWAVAGVIAAF